MLKCRTCLRRTDSKSGTNITNEFMLGKSVKDILLLFIPQMVTSSFASNFVCSKCTTQIRSFALFVESCIRVEKFLIEENIKSQRQDMKNQSNNQLNNTGTVVSGTVNNPPLNVIYIGLPTLNQNGVQNGVQSVQLKPIPINYMLAPSSSTNIIGRNIVAQTSTQTTLKHPTFILPKKDSESIIPEIDLTIEESNENDNTQVVSPPKKKKHVDLAEATQEKLCESCDSFFTPDESAAAECSKCAVDRQLLLDILDEPSIDGSNNSDDEDNKELDLLTEIEDVISVKEQSSEENPLEDHIKNELRDTVLSVTQPSEKIGEFLKDFSSKAKIEVVKHSSPDNMEKKRILFVGNFTETTQCSQCKILLDRPQFLKDHFREVHNRSDVGTAEESEDEVVESSKKTFECPFCQFKLSTAMKLVEHLHEMHTVENPFKCQKCGKEFKKRDIYLDHVKKFKDSADCSMKKCGFCMKMFSKKEYDKHVKTHKAVVCDQCGKSFTSGRDFRMHYAVHGEDVNPEIRNRIEDPHLCPICGKLFGSAQNWRQHLKIHEDRTRDYMCHKCPKKFLTPMSLKNHLSISHGEKKYECPICNIKVTTSSALASHHKLKHSHTQSHVCNICGEGFSRGDYFRRHMASHTNAGAGDRGNSKPRGKKKYNFTVEIDGKSVKCKYCFKVFKTVYLLRTHVLSHVKSMRYKCKFCNMTFANSGTRFRHQKRHADPNFDLSCTVCWKRLDNKEELQRHLAKHEECKRYKCSECGELLSSKYLLSHHMSEQHIPQEEVEKEKRIVLATALKEFLL